MKLAIVSGTSGNLGQAVANQLLNNGFLVYGTALLPGAPGGYTGERIDLADEMAAGAWVRDIISKKAAIDTAILTVGGFAMGDIESTTTSAIQQQVRLNFETAYNVARPVFVQMKKQGYGTIFLVGAQAGMDAIKNEGMIAYGLSKSLLFRLADLMNLEAADMAVKTVVVVPFIIDTPQNRAAMPDADTTKWQTPQQLADCIYEYAIRPEGRESRIIF